LRSAHLGAAAACSRVCAAGDGSMMGFPSRESAAANAQRNVRDQPRGYCVGDTWGYRALDIYSILSDHDASM
jgi:hypothetical protein